MKHVGRYRIVKRIGSGGMAEVLEGVAVGEHGFERRVAIKRLLATTGEDAERYQRMFVDEARIASQLHHANIVAVLDYGIADGSPFQVLEHVDGIDSWALLQLAGGQIPVEQALHLCATVAHALEHAHTVTDAQGTPLGIVHRDVTPGNILVSWSGDIKLTDFGIAFAHGKAERTMDGTTKGTPLFMAPEQMLAETTDQRTDLFSLGCVLHTLVAGWSPLSKHDQLFHLAAGDELVIGDELPEDVRAIVTRATRHARRDRYASAAEFVAACAAALARRTVIDPRTSLRDWVRQLRDGSSPARAAPPPARGRLDALLDVDLVLDRADDDVRQFHTVADATRPARPIAKAPDAPRVLPPEAVTERAAAKPPRRRAWISIAIGASLVLGLVIVLFAMRGDPAPPEEAPIATAPPVDAAPAPQPPPTAPIAVAVAVASPPDAAPAPTTPDGPTTPPTVDPPPLTGTAARPPTRATVPATKTATKTAPPPAPAPAQDDPFIADWRNRHQAAATGFDEWVEAQPAAAKALRAWDQRSPSAANQLVTWLVEHPDGTFESFLDAVPTSTFSGVFDRYRPAFDELLRWIHSRAKRLAKLTRGDHGFPWKPAS